MVEALGDRGGEGPSNGRIRRKGERDGVWERGQVVIPPPVSQSGDHTLGAL